MHGLQTMKVLSIPSVRVIHVGLFPRAYLRHLFISNEILSARMLSVHNLALYQRLMKSIREAIRKGENALSELRAEVFGWNQPLP